MIILDCVILTLLCYELNNFWTRVILCNLGATQFRASWSRDRAEKHLIGCQDPLGLGLNLFENFYIKRLRLARRHRRVNLNVSGQQRQLRSF